MKELNNQLVESTIESVILSYPEPYNLSVIDYGCGYAPFAELVTGLGCSYLGVDISDDCIQFLENNGYSACKPSEVKYDERFDILLLGNMSGIDAGKQLVSIRKQLKDKSSVVVWDFSTQRLPLGKKQELAVISVTSKEG